MGAKCGFNQRGSDRRLGALVVAAVVAASIAAPAARAEAIKIGLIHLAAQAPNYLAVERGYFAAEGLEATIVPFTAAEPVSVAVASGDVDIGDVAPTGGLYNLAGQGALKIIGGVAREVSGFKFFGFVVAKSVYEGGLKSAKDLSGHSVALTQIGGGYHYALALLAEKYGVDLKTVRILPLQSIPNIASALTGGQADAAMLNTVALAPLVEHGTVKVAAWTGEETPYQVTVLFASSRTTDRKADLLNRYLRAYRKGASDYAEAFVGEDGKRADGPGSAEISAIIARYTGLSPAQVAASIAFVDPEARLDIRDIRHQVQWFKAQGLIKDNVNADAIIDTRFAVALPEQ